MSETIYLVGSEQVANAGRNIAQAAEEFRMQVGFFSETVERLVRALNEHAERVEVALADKPAKEL